MIETDIRKISLLLLAISIFFSTMATSPLIPYQKNGLWGYADTAGQIVVKPIYTSVSHFGGDGSCYIVEMTGKFGLLNNQGERLSDLKYDHLKFMYRNEALIAKADKKLGVLDFSGETIVSLIYDDIIENKKGSFTYFKDDTMGKYSLSTNSMIDEERTSEVSVEEEIELPQRSEETAKREDISYLTFVAGEKYELVKKTISITFKGGRRINEETTIDTLQFQFNKIVPLNYHNAQFVLFNKNRNWGIIHDDQITVKAKYDSIKPIAINSNCNNFFFMVKQKGLWGIIDTSGKTIIPVSYDGVFYETKSTSTSMFCFDTNNGIRIKQNGMYGVVNFDNQVVLPVNQDSIFYDERNAYHIYYKDNKKGVYFHHFDTKPVLDPDEKLSHKTKSNGIQLLRVLYKKNDQSQSGELKGYVNAYGIKFYED